VIQPFVCEKKQFAQKFPENRRTDDGHRAIALAHTWNELIKMNAIKYLNLLTKK